MPERRARAESAGGLSIKLPPMRLIPAGFRPPQAHAHTFCPLRWPLELLRGSQSPRRAVCGTRGSLRTMHGGGSAPSCCAPWGFPGKSTGVGCHCLLRDPPQSLPKFALRPVTTESITSSSATTHSISVPCTLPPTSPPPHSPPAGQPR